MFRRMRARHGTSQYWTTTKQDIPGAVFAIYGRRRGPVHSSSCRVPPTVRAGPSRWPHRGILPDTCTMSAIKYRSMSKVNIAIFFLIYPLADIACAQGAAAGIVQKMEATCTRVCHGPSLITQQRLDVAGWTREVNKMVGWGAEIEGGDKEELVRYLAAQFNANRSRPSSSQAAPEGKGKDVFQNSCLGCHD